MPPDRGLLTAGASNLCVRTKRLPREVPLVHRVKHAIAHNVDAVGNGQAGADSATHPVSGGRSRLLYLGDVDRRHSVRKS